MTMQGKNGQKGTTASVSCGQSSRILEKMGTFLRKNPAFLAQECRNRQNCVVTTIDSQKAKLYSERVRTQVGLRLGAGRTGAAKSAGGGIPYEIQRKDLSFIEFVVRQDRASVNGFLRWDPLSLTGGEYMKRTLRIAAIASLLLWAAFLPSTALAISVGEAVNAVADRLAAEQIQIGDYRGSWAGEADFTGSIVGGMVSAYEATSLSTYRAAAELGGDYILWSAQGNFFGDEALALTRLSQIAADPNNNAWRTAVADFYAVVKTDYPGGTQRYVEDFVGTEPSTAVFYMANHVVAAYYVDAADKAIWRQGLIAWLCRVDDSSQFPVMALGVATWALAQTGPLDNSFISPSGEGAPYWIGKRLKDLPNLLLSHQVAEGQPGAGSFYWRFNHSDGDLNNCTEDTIFATLGLLAASQLYTDPNVGSAVDAARPALLGGVTSEGIVWERLSQEGAIRCAYAGEMLQALAALPIPGDVNGDGRVDLADFEILISQWGTSGCSDPAWCAGADINKDGQVDSADLQIVLDSLQNY